MYLCAGVSRSPFKRSKESSSSKTPTSPCFMEMLSRTSETSMPPSGALYLPKLVPSSFLISIMLVIDIDRFRICSRASDLLRIQYLLSNLEILIPRQEGARQGNHRTRENSIERNPGIANIKLCNAEHTGAQKPKSEQHR